MAGNIEKEEVSMIKTKAELYKLFSDATKKVKNILDLGNALRVVYETEDVFTDTPGYSSLISAILVTAHARLQILKYIHMIPEQDVIYTDKDSVIFRHNKNDSLPINNIGSECGQIASELPDGAFIKRFASTGPKSYFFEILHTDNSTQTVAKLKGISLTRQVLREGIKLDDGLDTIFEFVKNNYAENRHITSPLVINQTHIAPNTRNQITMRTSKKRIGNDFNKRQLIDNYRTVPWGYR